jgi:preprotein translocase subunit SecE
MKKCIQKIKSSFASIHWPNKKNIVSDTIFTALVTLVVSVAILGWTTMIDTIVSFVVSLL